ncbi:hypothetical protein ACJX0J_022692 [Zea mays]
MALMLPISALQKLGPMMHQGYPSYVHFWELAAVRRCRIMMTGSKNEAHYLTLLIGIYKEEKKGGGFTRIRAVIRAWNRDRAASPEIQYGFGQMTKKEGTKHETLLQNSKCSGLLFASTHYNPVAQLHQNMIVDVDQPHTFVSEVRACTESSMFFKTNAMFIKKR